MSYLPLTPQSSTDATSLIGSEIGLLGFYSFARILPGLQLSKLFIILCLFQRVVTFCLCTCTVPSLGYSLSLISAWLLGCKLKGSEVWSLFFPFRWVQNAVRLMATSILSDHLPPQFTCLHLESMKGEDLIFLTYVVFLSIHIFGHFISRLCIITSSKFSNSPFTVITKNVYFVIL